MGNVTSRFRPGVRLRLRVGAVALLGEINEVVLQRISGCRHILETCTRTMVMVLGERELSQGQVVIPVKSTAFPPKYHR